MEENLLGLPTPSTVSAPLQSALSPSQSRLSHPLGQVKLRLSSLATVRMD